MLFSELIAKLPSRAEFVQEKVPQGLAFVDRPAEGPGYIMPSFEVIKWPVDASVLVIEAAGAVGKSAAAMALSARLRWPLIRAEHAQVGSYSLSGLIQDALGFSSSYIQEMAIGEAGVVVDSLDEAHFRAGAQNFLAFLENIQRASGAIDPSSSPRKPSVVLFARTDTADLVKLSFADANLALAEIRLDFFNQEDARRFIDSHMARRFGETGRSEYNVRLRAPGPYERLRKLRFTQIAKALLHQQDGDIDKEWPRLRDFLGYAPVLVALAEALAVSNPAAARETLERDLALDESNLLRVIVQSILDREQQKFSSLIYARLVASLPVESDAQLDINTIYTSEEQAIRVSAVVDRNELRAAPPASLPTALRPAYEEAAKQFTADHPFVRNGQYASVVFGDWVQATTCLSTFAQLALERRPHLLVRKVGPFFAHFVSDQMKSAGVTEALVEALLSSWSQEAELSRFPFHEARVILGADASNLTCVEGKDIHDSTSKYDFKIVECTGALTLFGPLNNLTLLSDQGLILGRRTEQLSLGPTAIIAANELVVDAEIVVVEPVRGKEGGVTLSALAAFSADYVIQVRATTDQLTVYVDSPPQAFRPYASTLTMESNVVPYFDYVDLRAILTSFKPSAAGGPAVYWEKLDRAILKDNLNRKRLYKALSNAQVTYRSGDLYRLDLTALAALKFNLSDVKGGNPSPNVLSFLARTRYAETHDDVDS